MLFNSIIAQEIYAVGIRGDRFTHYVLPTAQWQKDSSLCKITPTGENWQSRSGTGRICNACQSIACNMKPVVRVVQPAKSWMFRMRKGRAV